ncbi:27849_t:CDS:2, partial [Racocetra persica]
MPKYQKQNGVNLTPYDKKKPRKIFSKEKINFYVSKKEWQMNLILLENSLINCYPCLEEHLEAIKILKNIQKDQASQIEEIKGKISINKKNETKFKDETVEEVEEIEE